MPGRALSELPLLSEGEREQVLEEWNETAEKVLAGESVHGVVRGAGGAEAGGGGGGV